MAAAIGFYCIGIIPLAGIEIHSRGFYAMGDTRSPVGLAVLAVAFNFALSSVLWSSYGPNVLALSVSLSSWIEWVLLYTLYVRRTGAAWSGDLMALARFAFCGSIMALFLAIAFLPFDTGGRIHEGLIALAGAASGLLVYVGMANWLGIDELQQATARLRARLHR